MRLGMLGPVQVSDGAGPPVPVAGARLCALLIRLALEPGRVVGTPALADAVWGDEPPAGAAGALQALASRVRRLLPDPALLVAVSGGYRLDIEPDQVDAVRFDRLATAGRQALAQGDLAAAEDALAEALDLWRGPALAEVADAPFAAAPAARLAELRVAAAEDRAEARLQRGADVVAELEALVRAEPLRERPHAQLMRALHATGRSAQALAVYESLRERLADQLGIDPSAELAALHLRILRGETGGGRGNLRTALTSFVGRDTELARVAEALAGSRLVTLVGPGGAGKTRLATEAARAWAQQHGADVWVAELAPVRHSDELPGAVAEALRLHEVRMLDPAGRRGNAERLRDALADRRALLVLDNCEHLIQASAALADTLLGGCPGLTILATSREPLAITGESLCPVGPLPVPPPGTPPGPALGYPAVRLLADRAAAVRPGFAVTPSTVDDVVQICARLDGLPLAIELAAARLRTLPVDQVAGRLGDRFRLLTGGSRTALPRHRTLQAVVEWSWELLDAAERRLAQRFSVFLDGATMAAATGVCGADAWELLPSLVDKSLVTFADDGRYRMLETIRAYAGERLAEAGEAEQIRDAHAGYFLALAEQAEPWLRTREQLRWLAELTADRDNLTGALRWAIDSGDAVTALRLVGALGWYWTLRSQHAEAVAWSREALAVPGELPTDARTLVRIYLGLNLMATGELAESRQLLAQTADEPCGHPIAAVTPVMAAALRDQDEAALAVLPSLLEHPDPWVRGLGLTMRGALLTNRGDLAGADRALAEGLALFHEIGERWGRAIAVGSLAEARQLAGDHVGAIAAMEDAVALSTELGVPDDRLLALFQLAVERAHSGDVAGARADLARAARVADEVTEPAHRFLLHFGAAEVARMAGDPAAARAGFLRAKAELDTIHHLPPEGRIGTVTGLAFAELALGDRAAAGRWSQELDEIGRERNHRPTLAHAAVVRAQLSLADGDPAGAARLLALADIVRGTPNLGSPDVARISAGARAALGEQRYAVARAPATDLSWQDAAAQITGVAPDDRPRRTRVAGAVTLDGG